MVVVVCDVQVAEARREVSLFYFYEGLINWESLFIFV